MNRSIKFPIFAVLLLFCQTSIAQYEGSIKYGKAPIKYIKMDKIPQFPSAAAVVLAHRGEYFFSDEQEPPIIEYVHHKRIKIIDVQRVQFERFDLYLAPGEKFEKIRAYVYFPNGREYKLSQKEIILNESGDGGTEVFFDWPLLVDGCVIEYKTRSRSNYLDILTDWHFQLEYPCLESSLVFSMPIDVNYMMVPYYLDMLPKIVDQDIHYTGYSKKISWRSYNIPAIRLDIPYSDPSIYQAKLSFHFLDYEVRTSANPYNADWTELSNKLMEAEYFGGHLKNSEQVELLLKPMDLEDLSRPEQVATIKTFVRERIRWNQEYSMYPTDKLTAVIKGGVGNSADMNLLGLVSLRAIDFDAFPVLIRTRDLGPVNKDFPELNQLNHVLIYTQIDSTSLLLDFTTAEPLVDPLVAVDHGLLIGNEQSIWVNMDLSTAIDKYITEVAVDSNYLNVRSVHHAKGQSAKSLLETYKQDTTASIIVDRFMSVTPRMDLIDFSVKSTEVGFHSEIQAKVYDQIDRLDEGYSILPIWKSTFRKNALEPLSLSVPTEFPNSLDYHEQITYQLPADATNITIPEPLVITETADKLHFSYESTLDTTANKVLLDLHININQYYFKPSSYQTLLDFWQTLSQQLAEPVRFQTKMLR